MVRRQGSGGFSVFPAFDFHGSDFMRFLIVFALALFCIFSWIADAHALAYRDEERFMIPGQQDPVGAYNVKLSKIDASSLPELLAAKLSKTLKECVVGQSSLSDLQLFSYESDYNRSRNIFPNVIVDFSAFSNRKMKPCYQTYVPCRDGSCALLGYVYDKDASSWELGFALQVLSWDFGVRKSETPGESDTTYIGVVSDQPDCEAVGGAFHGSQCVQHFTWRGKGLDLLN